MEMAMSRPLRLEFSGALYHITARGNARQDIYFEASDFELFLAILNNVCERFNWIIHAYCLMTNHYHLLVETPEGNLSKGMRQLNGVFTQSMNRKHHKVGHLFQGRYKSILVDKDEYLLELCRYTVLNPVRAKMVDTADDWLWSSWHYIVATKSSPDWMATDALLNLFADNRKEAISKYIAFVHNGVGIDIWKNLQHQVFLGDEGFVEKHQLKQSELEGDLAEIPLKQRRIKASSLFEYETQSTTRNEAILKAFSSGGYTMKEIGNHFNLHYSRISRIVAKGKT